MQKKYLKPRETRTRSRRSQMSSSWRGSASLMTKKEVIGSSTGNGGDSRRSRPAEQRIFPSPKSLHGSDDEMLFDPQVRTAASILVQIKRSRSRSQGFDIKRVDDSSSSSKVEDVDNSSTTVPLPKTYFCKTCKKSYASYQALGGHTAGHNKRRKIKEERNEVDDSDSDDPAYIGESAPKYRCAICNQTFRSQRALGGHKKQQRGNPMHGKELKVPKVELD